MAPQYFYTFDMLNILNLNHKVRAVEHFGSTVYGTRTDKSDIDIIAITESDEDLYIIYQSKDYREFSDYSKDVDLHIISTRTFQELLDEHDIMALETYYQLHEDDKELFRFFLDLDKLRRKVSTVCSNSWSKARKKLDIPEEDDYLGLKSLFHSIRILSYGINLARDGKLDFKNVLIDANTGEKISCSNFWKQLQYEYSQGFRWKEFKAEYTPLQNSNATLFRLLAPKELN
jgi:predicted nucleotidyltransferase